VRFPLTNFSCADESNLFHPQDRAQSIPQISVLNVMPDSCVNFSCCVPLDVIRSIEILDLPSMSDALQKQRAFQFNEKLPAALETLPIMQRVVYSFRY
jgi:hypothetical protein